MNAPRSESRVAGIVTDAVICATAALSVIVVAAAVVWLAGLAEELRSTLRFGFGGVEDSPTELARLAVHNARLAGGTLICAGVASRLKARVRHLVDLLLAAVLTFNASAVGIAIGAYGTRAVSAMAAHLPVEFGAFSLAGGAYMQACKRALRVRELAAVTAATALLLLAAAALETHLSNGAPR